MSVKLLQLQAAGDLKKLGLHFQSKIAGFVGGGQVGQVEIVPDLEKGLRLNVILLGALWYQLTLKLSPDAATTVQSRHAQ